MIHSLILPVSTHNRCCWVDITGELQNSVTESGIVSGICSVSSLHTTAAITINENADPDVAIDFFNKLAKMVPQDPGFRHREGNSDSHIKAAFIGFHVQVSIARCMLVLGTWQSIYFCEFDGPRKRKCAITILGEHHATDTAPHSA